MLRLMQGMSGCGGEDEGGVEICCWFLEFHRSGKMFKVFKVKVRALRVSKDIGLSRVKYVKIEKQHRGRVWELR